MMFDRKSFNDQSLFPCPTLSALWVCVTPVRMVRIVMDVTPIRKKISKRICLHIVFEYGVFQNFQDTSESSNDNTNVVNAPREPSVVDQDPGVNISQNPPQIDHNCCYECGDSLNGIFCQQCICESCGKGEEINEEYERDCENRIDKLKIDFNEWGNEIQKKEQAYNEERNAAARRCMLSIIFDDDDDSIPLGDIIARSKVITPDLPIEEPKDSLIMGDGHINTTPETETISVETLVSNPSESDDFSLGECNLFDIDDSYYEKSTSRLTHLASISSEIVEVCVDDDDTDDDDDYDDDVYDCVDIEEDGGEIDLDISKIVDISLQEKLVESYLLIEKINAFSLSPPILISPIFCPSSTIPVVDLDLPLEEADVPSFSDDSILRGIESDRDSGEDTTSIDALPLDDSMILSRERVIYI
ncbi:hypothetical protein Tco_1507016 [Tanacetum coccineum]